MDKTCATCACWKRVGSAPVARRLMSDTGVVVVPPGDEGECVQGTPLADFRWPRTHHTQGCAQWRAPETNFDAGVRATGPEGGELQGAVAAPPSTAEVARPASHAELAEAKFARRARR